MIATMSGAEPIGELFLSSGFPAYVTEPPTEMVE
jgi:hypothetical protein